MGLTSRHRFTEHRLLPKVIPFCPRSANHTPATTPLTMEEVPQTLVNPQAQVRPLIAQPSVSRPWDAPAPLRLWHLASLDAPTVAVVWALAFAWAFNVHFPQRAILLLALAAWVVYVGDRILDARAGLRTAQTHRLRLRHHFHWRHRRILLPLAVLAACAAVWIFLVLLPPIAKQQDSALAVAALAYFTRVHSSRKLPPSGPQPQAPLLPPLISLVFSKELLVGLLFTAACALPALSRLPATTPIGPLLAPVAFFASLAWLNCQAIEHWESLPSQFEASQQLRGDRALKKSKGFSPFIDRTKSEGNLAPDGCHPQISANNLTFSAAIFLALTGLLLSSIEFPLHPRPAALLRAGAASALLLALLDRLRNRLSPLALRAAADLVLLTPLALMLR